MPDNITKLTLTTLRQRAQLGDRGRATLALAGPILASLLMSINHERADDAKNGRSGILLCQLAYFLKTDDDGALGDAFEYAVHQSIRACDREVVDPLFEVLTVNGVPDDTIDSIFFARDKQGDVVLIDPDPHLVGEKTLIIPGQNQDPLFVQDHLPTIDKALKSAKHRRELPASIAGFWKADLLIGNCKEDVWLGATVKSNRTKLEKAPGLAVGIIPSRPGTIVVPQWNPQLEMWVVEVPYDNAFMELFSCSWRLVTEFLKADAKVPKVRDLPDSEDRRNAAILAGLRRLTVLDAVGALAGQAQADLVEVSSATVTAIVMEGQDKGAIVDGVPRLAALPRTLPAAAIAQ
jgi:hypothetical protein